jgi:hypothetical protein
MAAKEISQLVVEKISQEAFDVNQLISDFDSFGVLSEIRHVDSPEHKDLRIQSDCKYEALMNWLKSGDASFSKLQIIQESIFNRKIQVKDGCSGIQENEVILEIPEKCIITSTVAFKSEIGAEVLNSGYKPPSAYPLLACFILQEKFLKTDSFWKPWFDVAPEVSEFRYSIPVCFPDEIFERMRGTDAYKMAFQRRTRNKSEFENLCKYVRTFRENFSFEQYVWARCIITTRSYGVEIDGVFNSAIIPFADFFNHSDVRETKWSFDSSRRSFRIVSTKSIQPGNPIHVYYGSKENSRFLAHYGFSVPGNDQIVVSLNPKILVTFSKNWSFSSILLPLRSHLLCKRNSKVKVTDKSKFLNEIPRPDINLCEGRNPSDFGICGGFFSRRSSSPQEVKKDDCSCFLSYPKLCTFCSGTFYSELYTGIDLLNEAEALTLLKRICVEQLSLYPTSYQTDITELDFLMNSSNDISSDDLNARRLCVNVCILEKELFVSILDFIDSTIPLLSFSINETEKFESFGKRSNRCMDYLTDVLMPLLKKEGSALEA